MKRLILAALVLAGLAACATSGRLTSAERLALYRAHAGEEVRDFQYFGSLNGWTELGDRALAVWTRPNQAYLLELTNPCLELDYAPAISVTSMMGRVSARFDKVLVHGGPDSGVRLPCRIQTIRPIDVKALRSQEAKLREARLAERAADDAAG